MDAPQSIEMRLIYPNRAARSVDKAAVKALAASIEAIGLLTPITVRPTTRSTAGGKTTDAYEIVAGRHRYEAASQLGLQRIACFVQSWDADDAALWEIDENLIRAELTDAQRAEHHARRRDIMVRKGLVAIQSQGRAKQGQVGPVSYARETAKSLGVSQRTVKRDLERGSKIAPEVLASVAGTPEDKGVVLDRLAKTAPGKQAATLAKIRTEASAPKPQKATPDPQPLAERQAQALIQAWERTPEPGRQWFCETFGLVRAAQSAA